MGVADTLVQVGLVGEALEAGPVAVFVFDDDLRYVAVNEYACALLGYTREELLALGAGSLSVAGDSMAEDAAVVEGRKPQGRTVLRCKDGTEVALRFRGCATRVAGMAFYVGVAWPA